MAPEWDDPKERARKRLEESLSKIGEARTFTHNLERLIFNYDKSEITTSDGKVISELYPVGRPIIMEVKRNWPICIDKEYEITRITDYTESHYEANAFMCLDRDVKANVSFIRTQYLAIQFYKIKKF